MVRLPVTPLAPRTAQTDGSSATSARDVMGRQCCNIFAGLDENGNRLCYPGCRVVTLVKMGEAEGVAYANKHRLL
jgi:hypothetical protein